MAGLFPTHLCIHTDYLCLWASISYRSCFGPLDIYKEVRDLTAHHRGTILDGSKEHDQNFGNIYGQQPSDKDSRIPEPSEVKKQRKWIREKDHFCVASWELL